MYKIGIVTMSDKGSRGEREDASGATIREMVAGLGTVEQYRVIPDDPEIIKATLIEYADQHKLDLVLTTGGTGLGPRDNTPDATLAVVDRLVPGLAEAMRAESLKKTPKAMLSRAVSGTRGQTLIINLPGSVKGVRECLEVVLPVLPHGLEILTGRGGECGQP
ncbi:molybdenum cofactor synthesis domain protein [Desulfotomaculum nigrificans CO-1-SRB]|uniref:Molybdenum cofactor synthesis domain protein n=1 Tax=Desulfotomaculum nigrificans (strain DSM 14880 / VKM B-2319 / CO-1-SRB) TaxID=868595 RepID=F6B7C2_DESCC|nr:MogA/MoaB family molybdenum cofactor biosynthesis protein [Desulfotomaculum nigrificans]AEF93372.1 molybdenum cofactor synthesis domain protein [Desulfotomaculum nigrificans CO-1-SRB]